MNSPPMCCSGQRLSTNATAANAKVSLGQRSFEPFFIQVPAIRRSAGLLPPRVGKRTGVDAVEAKRVNESQHQVFGARIVSRNRETDAPRAASRDSARG